MLNFDNDYSEGAHSKILEKLSEINYEKMIGYGYDIFCRSAAEKIKKACGIDGGEVYFLCGGTQTNQVVISSMLYHGEGVIAAESGHVNVHEAGAIELTGHKVMAIPSHLGKIDAAELDDFIDGFYCDENREHMVYPGMVYISHPTEYGTLYSKFELEEIHRICRKYNIPLYLDGARLGYALASPENELSLEEIAANCEVFYIGGTKVGAFLGEAVVFPADSPKRFITLVKQHGALLAKGWLLGVQFDCLFTDDLYMKIGKNAIEKAEIVKRALKEKGYELYIDSPTNQIFVTMEDKRLEQLSKKAIFSFILKNDPDHTTIRIATSWATTESDIKELIDIL